MSSLFIAGNGFDIAHGIPSMYSDFRRFVINLYPEALQLRDTKVYLEDIDDIYVDEFAAEILLNAMDKAAGKNWCDFEEALAEINFNDKFPLPNHKEDETEEEDNNLMYNYIIYMDVLTSLFINCTDFWQDFFRLWINSIQKKIDNREVVPKEELQTLFSDPNMRFFTFNYTKTLQRLYGIKQVTHIHNRVGQKLIFGHGKANDSTVHYGGKCSSGLHLFSSDLNNMLISFKKDTDTPLKKYNKFFKSLDDGIDKVYSFGFGYGKVDSVYIKKIISSISPNATWYFTEFESRDKEGMRIKKIKLRSYGFKGEFGYY